MVEIVVRVDGRVRARVAVPADADAETTATVARADARVIRLLAGRPVWDVDVIPGRLVNFVVG